MLRKIIALFLALAVLLCAFAGCASKPEVVSSGEASAMVEPAEVPAEEPCRYAQRLVDAAGSCLPKHGYRPQR